MMTEHFGGEADRQANQSRSSNKRRCARGVEVQRHSDGELKMKHRNPMLMLMPMPMMPMLLTMMMLPPFPIPTLSQIQLPPPNR